MTLPCKVPSGTTILPQGRARIGVLTAGLKPFELPPDPPRSQRTGKGLPWDDRGRHLPARAEIDAGALPGREETGRGIRAFTREVGDGFVSSARKRGLPGEGGVRDTSQGEVPLSPSLFRSAWPFHPIYPEESLMGCEAGRMRS